MLHKATSRKIGFEFEDARRCERFSDAFPGSLLAGE